MPEEHIAWLLSRSFGLSAALFLSLSVAWGLAFASRMAQTGPGSLGKAKGVHEALSLTALLFIILHAAVLLFDQYTSPGIFDIILPFYWGLGIGFGVLAAWIALVAGLAYYARGLIGNSWKIIHRFVLLAWAIMLVHIFMSGTEVVNAAFPAYLALLILPVIFSLTYRLLPK